ncbi:MAG: hypothetical protein H6936_15680 [Burkholderiales bacterium]|nr:hypothetical protein [Nitrosomonas sp.]MCP5276252.1 hypothetical protein [Burkholderiales bacterium]
MMKILSSFIFLVFIAFTTTYVSAGLSDEISGKSIRNTCDSQASEAAGTWRNACKELMSLDGYLSPEEIQYCNNQGEVMYQTVYRQCISSLFDGWTIFSNNF